MLSRLTQRLLKTSDEYSDVTIRCGNEEFKVHKAIMCPRSKYLEVVARKGTFKVRVQ